MFHVLKKGSTMPTKKEPQSVNLIAVLSNLRKISAKLFSTYFGPDSAIDKESIPDLNQRLQELERNARLIQSVVIGNCDFKIETPIDFRLAIDAVLRLAAAVDDCIAASRNLQQSHDLVSASRYEEKQFVLDKCKRNVCHNLAMVVNATQFDKITEHNAN